MQTILEAYNTPNDTASHINPIIRYRYIYTHTPTFTMSKGTAKIKISNEASYKHLIVKY
jgi:hypothetical protein